MATQWFSSTKDPLEQWSLDIGFSLFFYVFFTWVSLKMSQKSSWPLKSFSSAAFLSISNFGTLELTGDLIHQFCFFFPWAHQNRKVRKLRLFWVVISNMFWFKPILGKIPIMTERFKLGWNRQLVVCLVRLLPHISLNPELTGDLRWNIPWYWTVLGTKRGLTQKNTDGSNGSSCGFKDILRWRFVYCYHPKK